VTKPTLTRPLSLRARDEWTKIVLSASFRNVLKTTEHALKEIFSWVPFFGHLSWARKKGDKGADVLIPYPLRLGETSKRKRESL
jgi:hypothetical protein